MVESGIGPSSSILRKPSMEEVMEIGGVIIPSASSAAPPSMAGRISHFFCRLTSAYNENMPPSPRLSARRVRITYFTVVCNVRVQMIQESDPRISFSVITLSLMIAFST